MELAPIVLFVYARPWHTQQTIEALLHNAEASESILFIYSDAPKNAEAKKWVEETRRYIHTIIGFKEIHIIERDTNWGLANSLIDGITHLVNIYNQVIVLEDDIMVFPYFLKYMNEGLEKYRYEDKVASIHGYMYPHRQQLPETFFIKGADCWGWATWKRAWIFFNNDAQALLSEIQKQKLEREFEFDYSYPYVDMLKAQIQGKISSWAICWYASAFLNGMYTMYPGESMVRQIGMDGVNATHSSTTSIYNVDFRASPIHFDQEVFVQESEAGRKAFKSFFCSKILGRKGRIKRMFLLLKDLFRSSLN
ncbi:glycosyltransferase family 2 protein [Phocaeicola sp.]